MNRSLLHWLALLIPALAILAFDQLTKGWILSNLAFGQSITPIPALADYFAFTLSANRGAAFSLLPQFGDIFLIIVLAMCIGIVLFYHRLPTGNWLMRIALGVLLGGACGNACDRLRWGYVVDFFHIRIPGLLSNVSNFADHAIVFSIIVLFILQWRQDQNAAKSQIETAESSVETSKEGGEL